MIGNSLIGAFIFRELFMVLLRMRSLNMNSIIEIIPNYETAAALP
jgi:hypothetical protein